MIIFLDIDGVLAPKLLTNILGRGLIELMYGQAAFADNNKDKYGASFSPLAVSNLEKIIQATGASIVISSAWGVAGLHTMQEMWTDRNLPGNVIGVTPLLDGLRQGNKSLAIAVWLKRNKYKGEYVIIDDEDVPETITQANHFVSCISTVGLSNVVANKAIAILNGHKFCVCCKASVSKQDGNAFFNAKTFIILCPNCLGDKKKEGFIYQGN